MVAHIVLWKLCESALDNDKAHNGALAKEKLEALQGKVPSLRHIEVGLNFNASDAAYDLSLYTEFDSKEGLEAYQVHPEHMAVASFIRSVTNNRAVCDYEK